MSNKTFGDHMVYSIYQLKQLEKTQLPDLNKRRVQ